MRAIILGANGYIGKHLTDYLNLLDWDLTCYDIQTDSIFPNSLIEYFKLDISDKEKMAKIDFSCDYLFYFSGLTGTYNSFSKCDSFININEIGLLNLLSCIQLLDQKPKIIFPSTRLVYRGNETKDITENDAKEFKTIYAITKFNGEQYLEMYHRLYNIPFTVFRIGVPYGNKFDNFFSYGTIGFLLTCIKQKSEITLYGDGNQGRTFTHVTDICRQILEVSGKMESNCEIYNIFGENYKLVEIAQILANKFNVNIKNIAWPEIDLKLESGSTNFDFTKIKSIYQENLVFDFKSWIENYHL
jgi:UDP-glucose 4-epimerase